MAHFNKMFITALATVLLLGACKPDKLDIDASDIKVAPVKFMRFEKEFFAITPQNIEEKTAELSKKYGAFYQMFVNTLNGRYITAEDVGSSPADMAVMRKETPHAAGLAELSGDPSPITARGVFRSIQAAAWCCGSR